MGLLKNNKVLKGGDGSGLIASSVQEVNAKLPGF